jgi:hypothetical protein
MSAFTPVRRNRGRILHIIVPFAPGGVQDILRASISDDLGRRSARR